MHDKFIGKATKGQRIRNGQLRRDFARLFEIITDVRDPDFKEVEALANKYRFYFDENGEVKEVASKGVDYTAKRPSAEQMRKSAKGVG